MEEGTVCAFTVQKRGKFIYEKTVRLRNKNPIYQEELFAIQNAIEWISQTKFQEAVIITDIKSSIEVLKITFPRNSIIRSIYELLLGKTDFIIHLTWTEAHAGTEGNETADNLVKSAILENIYDDIKTLPFLIYLAKIFYKSNTISDW